MHKNYYVNNQLSIILTNFSFSVIEIKLQVKYKYQMKTFKSLIKINNVVLAAYWNKCLVEVLKGL